MSKTKKESVKRTRNFTAIGYPESLKDNWKEILIQTNLQCVISPLHDKDINDGTGEFKKPHYHIMILYEAPHTLEQAQEIFDSIGATKCQIVNSTTNALRYFCHLDNPEKAQYSKNDVICLNGIDYKALTERASDENAEIMNIIRFIRTYEIRSYIDFLTWCETNNQDWFVIATRKSTYAIERAIKSVNWHLEHNIPFTDLSNITRPEASQNGLETHITQDKESEK